MLTARKLGSSSSLVVKLDKLWARSTSSDVLNSPSTSVQINNLLGCTCRPDMGEESPSPKKTRYTHMSSINLVGHVTLLKYLEMMKPLTVAVRARRGRTSF